MEQPTIDSIKIAPDLDEIELNETTLSTKFNGLHIVFECERKWEPNSLKICFQQAIALSSKTHQIKQLLGFSGVNGELSVTEI